MYAVGSVELSVKGAYLVQDVQHFARVTCLYESLSSFCSLLEGSVFLAYLQRVVASSFFPSTFMALPWH